VAAASLALAAAAGCGGSGDGAASGAPAAYEEYACAGCHSLDGSRKSGPTFAGLAGSTVTLEDGKRVRATAAYLRRAIVEPDAETVKGYLPGVMTASVQGFDLASKPEDVRALVDLVEQQVLREDAVAVVEHVATRPGGVRLRRVDGRVDILVEEELRRQQRRAVQVDLGVDVGRAALVPARVDRQELDDPVRVRDLGAAQ